MVSMEHPQRLNRTGSLNGRRSDRYRGCELSIHIHALKKDDLKTVPLTYVRHVQKRGQTLAHSMCLVYQIMKYIPAYR